MRLHPTLPLVPVGKMTRSEYPDVAVDGDGDATFAWEAEYQPLLTRRLSAGGVLGPIDLLWISPRGFDPAVAVDADDNAAFTFGRLSSSGTFAHVAARFRAADGTLSSTKIISSTGLNAYSPNVVTDAAGRAIFSWHQYNGSYVRAQTRRRPPGGPFGATQHLSADGGTASSLQTAVAPSGDAIFAWERDGVIQARRMNADGTLGRVFDVSF